MWPYNYVLGHSPHAGSRSTVGDVSHEEAIGENGEHLDTLLIDS